MNLKRIFLSILIISLTSHVCAQLIVESNGNVGVKYAGSSTVNSYFSINGPGDSNICSYIMSGDSCHDVGLRLFKKDKVDTNHNYTEGMLCSVRQKQNSTRIAYGIYAQTFKESNVDTNSGRSYGVYAFAGNSTPGWNYGVFGTLYGNNNGAGVFGSSDNWDDGINTGDRYAGFFHGKVKVTNSVEATAFTVSSDFKLKENIEDVEYGSIDNIMKLNVVKYNLKHRAVEKGDTMTVPANYYTEDSILLTKKHYGLIAQELQTVYPDLVYEGGDGYLSVNYIELVPLLIKTIQELNEKVDNLTRNANKTDSRSLERTGVSDIFSSVLLYQNDPNPFNENTTIRCFIPTNIISAVLYIYDMNGRQIDKKKISERGDVSLAIEGNSFEAGIYIYSLITDGTVVDTKRMILTK